MRSMRESKRMPFDRWGRLAARVFGSWCLFPVSGVALWRAMTQRFLGKKNAMGSENT